jgi:hypothetical protein
MRSISRLCVSAVAFVGLVTGNGLVALRAAEPFAAEPFHDEPSVLAGTNGKQVVRAGDRWFAVWPDPARRQVLLATAKGKKAPLRLADWEKVVFVSADGKGLFPSDKSGPTLPSLAVDRKNRLHAAWTSGGAVWYARCAVSGAGPWRNVRDRQSWVGANGQTPHSILDGAVAGDLAVTDDGDVWLAAVKRARDAATTLCLAHNAGKWEFADLADGKGFHPPVCHVSSDQTIHLAWSDTRGQVLYFRYRRGEKTAPRILVTGGFSANGRNPAIISNGRQVLVAYESFYAQIEYAVERDGEWRTNQRLTRQDPRFATDVMHSPQLVLDQHGVVWLFFADATRQFTYFTRWLGSSWSDIYDCRGIHYRAPRFETNLLGADWLGVEKYPPAQAVDLGLVLVNNLAGERTEFHRIPIATPAAASGSSVLFFDLLETAELEGVELVLDEARKHPHNPLLKPGPPGSFDQDRVFNHGSVLFDNDKFRMWYAGVHRQKGLHWWEWLSIGYAESKDGLAWAKVPTGVPGAEKEADRNRLPALPWPCVVFKDANEPNPDRRYKAVQFDRHQRQVMAALRGEYDMKDPTCPGRLFFSADGTHWSSEPVALASPDGKPWEFVVQSFFIDPREPDPARRWKAYGYATLTARRRAGCFAYSADGRKWISYPRNPILDPTVSEVPMVPAGPQKQIHDTVVFPYRGYYLALFEAQRDQHFLDIELAVSRDGEHFQHVKPGQKVITLGAPGTWDWQMILPTAPVVTGREVRLYYGGLAPPPDPSGKLVPGDDNLKCNPGLATLRLDGFTHLQLAKGVSAGHLTTVPFVVPDDKPVHLVFNARCSADARLTVAVLDVTTGLPLAGYTRHDCDPCTKDDVRHLVRWKTKDRIQLPAGKRLSLRFEFEGKSAKPELYGFGFAAPEK